MPQQPGHPAHPDWPHAISVGLLRLILPAIFVVADGYAAAGSADTLHAWNGGPTKTALVQFVKDVTTEGGPDYVPPAERIAVFSNDGTLAPELPCGVQLAFALDRVKALAAKHPQWRSKEPFRSALARNMSALAAQGVRGSLQLVAATCSGMSTDEFSETVRSWLEKARNARLNRRYTQCPYLPMQELLAFLRGNGFTCYLISSGDLAFMRIWAEKAYGMDPDQVIGSPCRMKFQVRKSGSVLIRLPEFDLLGEGAVRPGGIDRAMGRRPIAAFGSADSDLEMLQYATGGSGRHIGLIIHHTNGGNEFAYDRKAAFGRLDKALDAAKKSGWVIADMTKDWNRVFTKVEK
ncbi:MAG TPA: HAD family hydrolase [Bacteroidota bacterium]|nr:HAD family hydrolase [Bacteroidota bacterium]